MKNMSIYRTGRVLFPEHESAFIIINADNIPFTEARVGETKPLASYSIYRPASEKIAVFEYIIDGEGEIFIDGEWRTARAGDFYILAPQDEQKYRSCPKNPWHKIWINYLSDYMESVLLAYGVKTGIYKSEHVAEIFAQVFALRDSSLSENEIAYVVAERLHSIVAEASRVARCEVKENKLRSAVSRYIFKKFNLDDLAFEMHMSKSNLIRSFRKECGVTPYEYLLQLKIDTAKSLLRDSDLPVYEIAECLAVSDEHYFSAVFKKRTGLTPGAYRKKYRAGISART